MAGSVIANPFAKPAPQARSVNDPSNQIADPNKALNDPANKGDPGIDPNKKILDKGDDPMLDFKTLWENEPEDPEHPKEPEDTSFLPKIDPTKLAEGLNKIDFSKYATTEELAAITAGGEGATKAHQSILNKSLRQSMLTMFNLSHRLVESGLSKAQDRFLGKVPSHVKNILVDGNLTKSSKLMSNPAFAPMIETAKQRFQEKFPKASADQVSNAVDRYMQELVKEATAKEKNEDPDNPAKLKTGAGDADWDQWIEEELKQSL